MKHIRCNFLSTVMLFLVIFACSQVQSEKFKEKDFKNPPQNTKINVWWHWMDGNITREGITKDLEAMHSQGIVQATILNVGLRGRDVGIPKIKFSSEQWYDMFYWALSESKRLGITIGVHNCDGWSSSGGPWITPDQSMKQFSWTKMFVKGGEMIHVKLNQPFSLQNFYKDVAVVAWKTDEYSNSFQQASPKIVLNDKEDATFINDGNPASGIRVKRNEFFTVTANAPLTFDKIVIHPYRAFVWGNPDAFTMSFSLLVSDDGKDFKKVGEYSIKALNQSSQVSVPSTSARFVRILIDDFDRENEWDFTPFTIGELELLKANENPSFSPGIPDLLGKTVSVKVRKEDILYSKGKNEAGRMISSVDQIIDLTGKMDKEGMLNWEAPQGNWAVLRFGYTTTGSTNRPATKEGRGLECDKMDSSAVNLHFNSFSSKLVEKAGALTGNTFKFILIDSWECAYQNWTDNFPGEFKKLRGYNLIPYLPALCGNMVGSPEESEAFLYDFRKTIADLIEQNYYEQFSKLCHRNKLQLHAEVIYGGTLFPPLDILKSTRYIDMPMYEHWTLTNSDNIIQYTPSGRPLLNLPVSAGIGYGKSVIGAESYTGDAHYSESPGELKPFGDRAYSSGINQFILHSYVHQPDDRKPGMTLGQNASHFNRNNLYWPYISEWINYQSRVQYILQQGTVSQDILYYLGDQLLQDFNFSQSTLPYGYQVNACNFDLLKNRIKVVRGKLLLNNTVSYALLHLPSHPYMNFETLKHIEELVKEGAIVYGPKPLYSLSMADVKSKQTTFQKLADQLWGNESEASASERNYGKGKVFRGIPLKDVLEKINLAPDFTTDQKGNKFQFIHKKTGNTDVWFVANEMNKSVTSECLFRVADKTPEILNPENGTSLRPAIYRFENGRTSIPVTFKPYESKLFVFKPGKSAGAISTVEKDGKQIYPSPDTLAIIPYVSFVKGGYAVESPLTGDYIFTTDTKQTLTARVEQPEEFRISDFNGNIHFETDYKANIPDLSINALKSITESDNPDIRYFSGKANYSLKFKAPGNFSQSNDPVLLDIGFFESVARVSLNGRLLGDLWKPGTTLTITGLLKPENTLDITVATVYRNRLIGDFVQYGKVTNLWTTSPVGELLGKNRPLKPSGLMGPLKLIKVKQTIIK